MNGADDRYTAAMGNYELLVRGILDLPNKPAIINVQYVHFLPCSTSDPTSLGYYPAHTIYLHPSFYPNPWDELTPSIFALMFRQLALGGDMVSLPFPTLSS
jgi:hypothetical protein